MVTPYSTVGALVSRVGLAMAGAMAARLPTRWLHASSRVVAPVLLCLAPELRAALMDNARMLLGPRATRLARSRHALRVIGSFGRFVVEMAAPGLPVDQGLFTRMRGREHWDTARTEGRGVIGISLHMGNYEAGPLLLSHEVQPLLVLYQSDPSGVFETLRSRLRSNHRVREMAIDQHPFFAIDALAALRAEGMVLASGDLGFAWSDGIESTFLGGRARFAEWPLRLALSSGAPLLPCFIVRESGRYQLEIKPPVIPAKGDDTVSLLEQLIPAFEDMVRRFPDQWLIVHRYWSA